MKQLSPELYEAIKAAVLDDKAPAILQAIYDIGEAESQRLRPDFTAKKMPEDPMKYLAARMDEERERDAKPEEPWLWWMIFASSLDYSARELQRKIDERPMTRAAIQQKQRDAEIRRKQAEIDQLQRA